MAHSITGSTVVTPGELAEEAKRIASEYSDVFSASILDTEQAMKTGSHVGISMTVASTPGIFGAKQAGKLGSHLGKTAASTLGILDAKQARKTGSDSGVTVPSAPAPYFIHLVYRPGGEVKSKLAIVGKGLTFDRGDYNIKTGPGGSTELRKFDMGGSAAVLGAAKALGQIKPAGVEVHFIVAAYENMVSGTEMRPGNITLTDSNGKTIEVNETVDECTLVLAEALVYARNQGVDKIVDVSTLTGDFAAASGPSIAGIFTSSDDLAKEILAASETSGENWGEDNYYSMKSGVADTVNTGGRQGGAITEALFLNQFVDETTQWMHIDVSGPVLDDKDNATGFGVSTLVEWVQKNSSQFVDEKAQGMHIDVSGPVLDNKDSATGFGVSTLVEWVQKDSSQFVDEKAQGMHIDIAGPVLDNKDSATGFGVSTLEEWVQKTSS